MTQENEKITPEHIEALYSKLEFHTVPISVTNMYCGAYLGTFRIAGGFSACVDPAKFNPEIGKKAALENAQAAAKEKLWELEGYRLFCKLNGI